MKRLGWMIIFGLLVSCRTTPPSPQQPAPNANKTAQPSQQSSAMSEAANFGNPQTRPQANPGLMSINVMQLAVPIGSVSKNNDFWKLVTEDSVDAAAEKLLLFNGIRVGHANLADWPRFRETLDRDVCYSRPTRFISLPGNGTCMLDMTGEIAGETMFVYNPHQNGRTYGPCQNFFYFSFQWAPHEADTMRVSVCPTVMTLRQRMDYTDTDNGVEQGATIPETIYDLALRADIPPNEFLIIGPSTEASDPTRLGNHFLVCPKPSEQLEQVILVVGKEIDLTHAKTKFYPVQPGTLVKSNGAPQ